MKLESDERENKKISSTDSNKENLEEKTEEKEMDVEKKESELKTSLTATELYEWLQQNRSYLLIDCRPEIDFAESKIKSDAIINVPSNVLRPGCIAQHLEAEIPIQYRKLFYQRRSFEYIIIFDWDSMRISDNSPLKFLFDALNLYDSKGRLRNAPLLLQGGYQEFLFHYPTICTKTLDESKIEKISGNFLAENFNAAEIFYPDLASIRSGTANRVPLPTAAVIESNAEEPSSASTFAKKSEAEVRNFLSVRKFLTKFFSFLKISKNKRI